MCCMSFVYSAILSFVPVLNNQIVVIELCILRTWGVQGSILIRSLPTAQFLVYLFLNKSHLNQSFAYST